MKSTSSEEVLLRQMAMRIDLVRYLLSLKKYTLDEKVEIMREQFQVINKLTAKWKYQLKLKTKV